MQKIPPGKPAGFSPQRIFLRVRKYYTSHDLKLQHLPRRHRCPSGRILEPLNHPAQAVVKTQGAFPPLRVGRADGERAGVRCLSDQLGAHGKAGRLHAAGSSISCISWLKLFPNPDPRLKPLNHPAQAMASLVTFRKWWLSARTLRLS